MQGLSVQEFKLAFPIVYELGVGFWFIDDFIAIGWGKEGYYVVLRENEVAKVCHALDLFTIVWYNKLTDKWEF